MQCFRRRIQLRGRHDGEGGEVRAALEDDFHHFRVLLRHTHGEVSACHGEAPRHPFSACPGATGALEALIGMPLDKVASAVSRHTDPSQQCTHMFDLAGLAVAAAARGIERRSFEIEVPRHLSGYSQARLVRDDGLRIDWEVREGLILSPAPYSNVDLRRGMARWALETLAADVAEAAIVLRRCALISLGRLKDIDKLPHARPSGHCYAQQPERAGQAIRIVGSTWDFSEHRDDLCCDDRAWLEALGSAMPDASGVRS